MNLNDQVSRSSGVSIASGTHATQKTFGCPFVAVEVTGSSSLDVKVYGAGPSGTFRTIRSVLLAGTGTETQVDPNVATGAMAVQDIILIPSVGFEMVQLQRNGGSGTVAFTCYPSDGLPAWLLMKILDGGLTATVTGATVVGTVADDATTPGDPVMVGGQAKETDGTDPGSVSAEDDVVRAIFDRNRRLLVGIGHPNGWSASVDYAAAQTNATVKAAPAAGLFLYVTSIFLSNGATAGNVTLLNGSGGSVLWECYPAVNGGAHCVFVNPIRLSEATLLAITSTTVTTHSLTVNGYTAP